jgi:hypothetical protein
MAFDGERLLQEILVNAQIRIEEERTSDNWNGGTYGHGLFLTLPEAIYLKSAKQRGALQERITQDLNKLHNVQNEHICDVFLEMQLSEAKGLASRWETAAIDIAKILIKQERALHYYIQALKGCPSFDTGNTLSMVLGSIDNVPREQGDLLVDAYNGSYELRGSFGFNGTRPSVHGAGLLHHLHRWGFSFCSKEQDGTIGVAF